jgi:hypothetical protein
MPKEFAIYSYKVLNCGCFCSDKVVSGRRLGIVEVNCLSIRNIFV